MEIKHNNITIRVIDTTDGEDFKGLELVVSCDGVEFSAARMEIATHDPDFNGPVLQLLVWQPNREFWGDQEPRKEIVFPLDKAPDLIETITKETN